MRTRKEGGRLGGGVDGGGVVLKDAETCRRGVWQQCDSVSYNTRTRSTSEVRLDRGMPRALRTNPTCRETPKCRSKASGRMARIR